MRGNGAPRVNQDFFCLLWGEGKAEVRVAFNDRAERYHSRNLVTERVTNYQSPILSVGSVCRPLNSSNPWVPKITDCFQIGVSITNQDIVCLLWGEGRAEVRVALYPLGTQNKQPVYFGRAET